MAGSKSKKPVPQTGIETPDELLAITQAQEEVINQLTEENNTLKISLADVQKGGKPAKPAPIEFEYEGQQYPFPAPVFILPGYGRVTAEDAKDNPKILRTLVELKAGKIA